MKLLLPIARGIAYAHERGIIHRDIKPANILITESGEPMLSDFGIAKILEMGQMTALTGTGMAIGTPEYMAPEQWTGKTSPQSDLYSLGIVLYEMVTGRKPYVADTPAAILLKQATEPLPRPSQFAPSLPDSVEWVLIKTLAKNPEDRYRDMNALIEAMEGLLLGAPILHVPPAPTNIQENPVAEQEQPIRSIPTEMEMQAGGTTVSPTIAPAAQRSSEQKADWQVGQNFSQKQEKHSHRLSPRIIAMVATIVIILISAVGLFLNQQWFAAAPRITEAATAAKAVTFAPTSTFTVLPSNTPPKLPACSPKCTNKDMVVGFIQTGPEGGWRGANTVSFKETATKLGITLKFYDAQNKFENQVSAFRNFIADPEVNVIVLAALANAGWDDVLNEARAAGKVVIIEDRRIDASADLYATYVGSDFVLEGQKAGEEMCKLLEGSARKNVVELVGDVNSSAAKDRGVGFRKTMTACGIVITESQTANWDITEGKKVMAVFLKKSKDIQGVFAQNDEMGLGAALAIKEAGLKPGVDIKILTIDATAAAFKAMIAGNINTVVECNPLLAPQVYEAALRALNGETLPKWIPSAEGVFYQADAKKILPTRKY
jgi:simple sugar transport system substrate-binding protein